MTATEHLNVVITTLQRNPTIKNLTSIPLTTRVSILRSTFLDPYVLSPLASLLAASTQKDEEEVFEDTTQSMPDLISLIILGLILLVSLKVVDYAHRVIVFWVSLALRVAFWGLVVVVSCYVYQLGVGECLRDFAWVRDLVVNAFYGVGVAG